MEVLLSKVSATMRLASSLIWGHPSPPLYAVFKFGAMCVFLLIAAVQMFLQSPEPSLTCCPDHATGDELCHSVGRSIPTSHSKEYGLMHK